MAASWGNSTTEDWGVGSSAKDQGESNKDSGDKNQGDSGWGSSGWGAESNDNRVRGNDWGGNKGRGNSDRGGRGNGWGGNRSRGDRSNNWDNNNRDRSYGDRDIRSNSWKGENNGSSNGGWGNSDWNTSNDDQNTNNRGRRGQSWSGGRGRGGNDNWKSNNRNQDNNGGSESWGSGGDSWGASNNNRGGRGSWGGNGGRSNNNDNWESNNKNQDNNGRGESWGSGGDSWGASNNNREGRGSWGGNKDRDNNDRSAKNDWGGSSDNWSRNNKNHGDSGWSSGGNSDNWGANDDQGNTSIDQGRRPRNIDGHDGKPNERDGDERPAPYKPEDLDLEEEAKLQGDGAGENFHRYKDQKVTCVPLDVVKPIEKFSDVLQSKLLLGNVQKLGYSDMTPIQKWAMPAIIGGHDIIGCAQTGSGKTAAFLLPILQTIMKTELESHDPNTDCQNPYCLIISPTRELARQIYLHAEMLSKDSIVKCRVIYGQVATAHLKAKISQGCHILVATPGRLKDFVQRGWIGFKNIKYIILDEGDRLVDEGFTSDIRGFFNHETMPPKEDRQTLFFSATFKEEVQHNAKEYLKESFIFLAVGRVGAANEDIKQEFLQVSRQDKKRELKKILNSVPETDKTIVFTQTKVAADMLASFFSALNLSSTSIHGDRHQSQREQAISSFKKGEKRFLISSPVGNRGLDLPKVALVINYDLPDNIDEYVHRIGRTGRAGHTGRAISFYDAERDNELLPSLLKILEEAKQEIPDWMKGDGGFVSGAGNDDWAQPATEGAAVGNDADWGSAFSEWNSPAGNKRSADTPAGNSPKRLDNCSPEKATAPSNSDDWGSGW